MRRTALLLAAALSVTAAPSFAADVSAAVPAAVANSGRPAADTARDANRKPADVVAFSGMKAGDKVLDIIAGGGYFTRIFSKVVGPKGHVYAHVPEAMLKNRPTAADGVKAIAADPAYANVTVLVQAADALSTPEKVDVAWTSDNYHDLHNASFATDIDKFNKAVFDSLKPGGIFLVLDHSAAKGAGFTATQTLHRSEPDAVKAEVLKAGFVFVGSSNALANPADDHTAQVRDSNVQGHTDQYVMTFKKPN